MHQYASVTRVSPQKHNEHSLWLVMKALLETTNLSLQFCNKVKSDCISTFYDWPQNAVPYVANDSESNI